MEKLSEFIGICNSHPWAYVAIVMNLAVVFMNGWTDGPNQIATVVTTRTLKPRIAIIMCAILNVFGVLLIGAFASALSKIAGGDVSKTIASLVDFSNVSTDKTLCAIAFGLVAVIVVSLICTKLALPSSQSNTLIGGLLGAGLSLLIVKNNIKIDVDPFVRVIVGFFGSLILGFILGYFITKLIQVIFKKVNKGKSTRFFNKGQIISSAFMSLLHGIQDGAKFIGVNMLIVAICFSSTSETVVLASSFSNIWWIYVPVAIFIFLGTMVGGQSIIKTLGKGVATLKKYQAFATDIAAIISLILATFFGLPVSTGTVKSSAIIGGGAARSFKRVKWNTAGKIVLWGFLSFPMSAFVGFLGTLLFIWTC